MPNSSPRVADLVDKKSRKRKRANSDGDIPKIMRVDFGRGSPDSYSDLGLGQRHLNERPKPSTRESFFMRNKILTWPVLSSGVFAGVFTGLISIPALHVTMSSVSGWVLSVLPAAITSKAFTAAVGAAFAGGLVGLAVGVCALLVCALYNKWLSSKSDASADIRQPLVGGQNGGKPTVVAPVKLTLESGASVANPTSDISMV